MPFQLSMSRSTIALLIAPAAGLIVVMALFSGMRSILELILVSYVVLAWVGLTHLFIKLGHAKAQ